MRAVRAPASEQLVIIKLPGARRTMLCAISFRFQNILGQAAGRRLPLTAQGDYWVIGLKPTASNTALASSPVR